MNKKILLIGLGNPGLPYQRNRHNIGALFIDWLQNEWATSPWKQSKKNLSWLSFSADNSIILARPLTYMNESGQVVGQLKKFYKVPLRNIIVVHDDTDLIFPNFKLGFNHGSAGHKGIESIMSHLKSKGFFRLRLGVRPESASQKKALDLVLKNFSKPEEEQLEHTFAVIKDYLEEKLKELSISSLQKSKRIV